jgi:hypothetical protein
MLLSSPTVKGGLIAQMGLFGRCFLVTPAKAGPFPPIRIPAPRLREGRLFAGMTCSLERCCMKWNSRRDEVLVAYSETQLTGAS